MKTVISVGYIKQINWWPTKARLYRRQKQAWLAPWYGLNNYILSMLLSCSLLTMRAFLLNRTDGTHLMLHISTHCKPNVIFTFELCLSTISPDFCSKGKLKRMESFRYADILLLFVCFVLFCTGATKRCCHIKPWVELEFGLTGLFPRRQTSHRHAQALNLNLSNK